VKLSYRKRQSLPSSEFAFPRERKEPLTNPRHVSNAIARFHQVSGVDAAERAQAKKRINAMRRRFHMPIYGF
jgi:hypothetical protein